MSDCNWSDPGNPEADRLEDGIERMRKRHLAAMAEKDEEIRRMREVLKTVQMVLSVAHTPRPEDRMAVCDAQAAIHAILGETKDISS